MKIILCVVVPLLLISEAGAASDAISGQRLISASRLIDMIGVNTHLQQLDGTYGDLPKVLQLFKFLGVTRARDVMPGGNTLGIVRRMIYDKIRFNFFIPTGWEKGRTVGYLKSLEANVPGAVTSVEGYNEINNHPVEFNGRSGPAAALFGQQAIYKAIKNDDILKDKPVLDLSGFEMTEASNPEKRVTLNGYADGMNLHVYAQNGSQPGHWIREGVPDIYRSLNDHPRKAITEFGYASLPQTGWRVIGVDERSQAKGLLNGIFDAAIAGFDWIYLYELVDQRFDSSSQNRELHFGLFKYDYQPKPAAFAIRNMIDVLNDDPKLATPSVADSSDDKVNISLDREPGDIAVRSLRIRKTNGSLVVAVWRETPFWDRAKGGPLEAPGLPSKISFHKPCGSIKLYDVLESRDPTLMKSSNSMTVDVKDYVQLVECTKV
ncbi:MAG: hypothetical protein J0H40_14470 [Rhizobiales bacterium]|nr:hypothetical protein [Hyphomicrobiales bacterium]